MTVVTQKLGHLLISAGGPTEAWEHPRVQVRGRAGGEKSNRVEEEEAAERQHEDW